MKRKVKIVSHNDLSSKRFKALIENAHEGIVLYNPKGLITYATPAVSKITGYKTSEVIGKPGTHFLHPEDVGMARNGFFELVPGEGKSLTLFQRIRHKKGHYIWSESRLTNFSHVPEINGIVSNFRDITESRLSEENARKTKELLETINRNLSEGIFMGIVEKEFIYVNEAFLNICGYRSFSELKHLKPAVIFSSLTEQKKILRSLKSSLTLNGIETIFKRKDKTEFWGVLNVRLLKHEGKGNYFVGTIRDITKEKVAEKELIDSRNFLNNIINTVAAPIFVKDQRNRLINFNDRFCDFVGKTRRQLTGKVDSFLGSTAEIRKHTKNDQEVLRSGTTISTEEVLTIRSKVHNVLMVRSRYVNEKGEKFLIGSLTDITHLKIAEMEIKRLHENLEGVLESAEESIFSVDKNLRYTAFNNRHKNIMKILYGANIRIGKNKIEYLQESPDKKWILPELRRALRGEHFATEHFQNFPRYKGYIQTTYNPIHDDADNVKGVAIFVQDITHRKRYEQIINSINANLRAVMESTSDGIVAVDRDFKVIIFNNSYAQGIKQVYGVGISVGLNFLEILPANVAKRVKENGQRAFQGKQFTIETEHPGKLILETSFNPIYDDSGGVTGAALFIRNVSDRRKLEEQLKHLNIELTDQNIQLASQEAELKSALAELSERNFELDQLMYKTSHDLRSPLSSIIGLINLANLDPDPAANRHYLSMIEGRAKKLDEFIRSMLDYARVNRLDVELEKLELAPFVKSCIAELEYMENFQKIKTQLNIKPAGATFCSDRLRLKIIFSNIISNAYKYLNPEVKSFLKITMRLTRNGLDLTFEDNGIGIKAEYHPKIFNMFYRATDRSQGSGLGMYIVKQSVEKLHGKISFDSEYGAGTRITIHLPNNPQPNDKS
jgi:PAS domain S-box-containing protein